MPLPLAQCENQLIVLVKIVVTHQHHHNSEIVSQTSLSTESSSTVSEQHQQCLDINQEDLLLLPLTCHHTLNSKHILIGQWFISLLIDNIIISELTPTNQAQSHQENCKQRW